MEKLQLRCPDVLLVLRSLIFRSLQALDSCFHLLYLCLDLSQVLSLDEIAAFLIFEVSELGVDQALSFSDLIRDVPFEIRNSLPRLLLGLSIFYIQSCILPLFVLHLNSETLDHGFFLLQFILKLLGSFACRQELF